MKATLIHGPGDIRVERVPDPELHTSTDAIVRVTHSCICGSDLWPYRGIDLSSTEEGPKRIGHEFLGVVEETGSEVNSPRPGDVVVAPFTFSDGDCAFCREGLPTSCVNGGGWGADGVDGAQGEAVRVPWAEGTLVTLPADGDDELNASLLTLSDVFSTGHHAAVSASVGLGSTVLVIGDGAVGLSGVLAADRLGAEQVIIMGRHPRRTELARRFGATDVVAERGPEGVERVRELTGGQGASSVLECVGTAESLATAVDAVRAGGAIGRVGAPVYENIPQPGRTFLKNVTISGGVAPARHYIPKLLPDVLEGRIRPGQVFDHTLGLDEIAEGYRAMHDREALKVLVRP
ncbi:zinc-dependent alcohol dehydrogenase family protein [Actinopolyspora mortivallis]|uniref:zinc-dependent alcohol dehydrogenase family protein n=1 Tax=Actinopolyspora mortivallis TaxID=33906 RepID=UPI00037A190B|nr:zinc-dependent alcohol dehydrogenase family protein [Actinopolyspora mortivallis]